jgi:hypothetical protein
MGLKRLSLPMISQSLPSVPKATLSKAGLVNAGPADLLPSALCLFRGTTSQVCVAHLLLAVTSTLHLQRR